MENKGVKYEFSAKVCYYSSSGSSMGWHIVFLPTYLTKEIRENLKCMEEGWGRMKVTVKIGNSEWQTAIWFDTKHNTYLLPLKADIRKKEKIEIGKEVETIIWI